MSKVTGGRVHVRAEGDPQPLTLVVSKEEHADGTICTKSTLTTGEVCEPIDGDTWRIVETGQVLHRVDPQHQTA